MTSVPSTQSLDHRARRRFRRWCGVGGGLAGMAASLARADRLLSESVTVVAGGIGAWPVPVRTAIFIGGCAVAVGLGAAMALPQAHAGRRVRVAMFAIWTVVAGLTTAANLVLAADFTFVPRLLITLPAGLALGAVATAAYFHAASPRPRDDAAIIAVAATRWAAAGIVGAFAILYTLYFVGAGTVDLFEAAGLSARAGRFVGVFLSGYLTAWLIAVVGGEYSSLTGAAEAHGRRASDRAAAAR
jgi:hypothetical protein